ncbi:MAG TPA: glycosyltransferase family 4 protein [Candidatus Polarisedimenticolia bacterium]|nr:glycosyltransferase family 4 protein [Candidatus Polarisedimenticolia bacterium]
MKESPPGHRKARICHIITCLELGGAQQNTLHTVTHLDRRRFQVSLIAGSGGYLDFEARAIPDLEVHFLDELHRDIHPWRDLLAFLRLVSLLRRIAPDVAHTHSSKAGILGRWAAHLAGVPHVVHTIHGFGFHADMPLGKRCLFQMLEASAAPLTTRFLAVSRANLEAGVRSGIFPRDKARILRSGVVLRSFRNGVSPGRLREELGIPAHAPLAGMVACLKPQKAPKDFVSAAARVAARLPEAHFILAGDGELRTEVEEAVRRQGLTGRFHLLGWRRDIPSLFKNLDLLVLTSLWEGLPRVVPEAMAAGLPVIATRVDGTPEAVLEGETGFLVEPHDVETLSERIAWLLTHRDTARIMGERGRSSVEEFDIDVMVRRQEELYTELLSKAPPE